METKLEAVIEPMVEQTAKLPAEGVTTEAANSAGQKPEGPSPSSESQVDGKADAAMRNAGDAMSQDKPVSPEPASADETVTLDYDLVLRGGGTEVVRMKSQLTLPLALESDNLSQTDLNFPTLVDQVVVKPLVTKFRGFLQKRFDGLTQAKARAAEQAAIQPSESGFRPPRSPAGYEFEALKKPTMPQPPMPGYFPNQTPN